MTLKDIDNICWFIPFRKLRDSIRELLTDIYKINIGINYVIYNLNNKNNDDTLIVSISGGFADQIYYYILSKKIELVYGKKIKYDISWYLEDGFDIEGKNKRIFELLNVFPELKLDMAKSEELLVYKNYFDFIYNYKPYVDDYYFDNVLSSKKNVYLYNYPCIFRDKYLDIFNNNILPLLDFDRYLFPKLDNVNLKYFNDIKSEMFSVACHIRRTDYLKVPDIKIPDKMYYKKAIELLSSKLNTNSLKIFFFSDDIDYVENELLPLIGNDFKYEVVSANNNEKGYIDFYLISLCKYQIASIGNFCKCAYIFNKFSDKIIITPDDI